MTTTALVIETNNLRGGEATAAVVTASLKRLLTRLTEQTRPVASIDEVVITHDGLDAESQCQLQETVRRPLKFVHLAEGTGYYEAKNVGFDATTADIVVFGDSDCWPDPRWLETLVEPVLSGACDVAAGRTTYRTDLLGTAATTIDFMYFASPFGAHCTRNFYANNVAFRRATFGDRRFPASAMYRGHCQLLGLRLLEDRVPIHFVPQARTIHRFPDSLREFVQLRLHRGSDLSALAPQLIQTNLRTQLPARAAKFAPPVVLAARLGFSLRSLNRQDMPPARGVRRAICAAGITGLSMLDLVGTWRGGGGQHVALSYHDDRDGLAAAA